MNNYISLSDINKIYSCSKVIYNGSSRVDINKHLLEHIEFRNFCLLLRNFENLIGENITDEYWKNFLRPLKEYRFKLCAAPLPFNYPKLCQSETVNFLNNSLSKCVYLYPNFTLLANKIFEQFVVLMQLNDNPILDFITQNYNSAVFLLKDSSLVSITRDILTQRNKAYNFDLLVPSQLRGIMVYNKLVVVGAKSWFPDYIFTAPRVEKIDVIQYSWLRDRRQYEESVFLGSLKILQEEPVEPLPSLHTEINKIKSVDLEDNLNSEEILLPSINLNQFTKSLYSFSKKSIEDEDIEARLFLLEGETGVFLDIQAKIIVIDLEDDEESRVKRISVNNIESGMFIVLRTAGGGDYVILIANYILGKKAQNLRKLQNFWKNLLKTQVRNSSLDNVSKNLVHLGSKMAKHEQNLRNWMSDRTIRPKDDNDFNAILRFLGLEDRLKEFHEVANEINSAHLKAGRYIRKLLLQQVCNSDLQKLEQQGRMYFELPEAHGGSMTAFRVWDMSTETIILPYARIAEPFLIKNEIIND